MVDHGQPWFNHGSFLVGQSPELARSAMLLPERLKFYHAPLSLVCQQLTGVASYTSFAVRTPCATTAYALSGDAVIAGRYNYRPTIQVINFSFIFPYTS